MRKKIVIMVSVLCILLVCAGFYWYLHPTHFAYNDRFILGSSKEEITARYGEFSREYTDENNTLTKAEYKISDNTPELVMSYDNSLWYEIYFQGGVAVEVVLREGYLGG